MYVCMYVLTQVITGTYLQTRTRISDEQKFCSYLIMLFKCYVFYVMLLHVTATYYNSLFFCEIVTKRNVAKSISN